MSLLPNVVGSLIALATGAAIAVDHGLARRVPAMLDRSIYRGPADRRAVALTFDDGPSPHTPELLAYLKQEGVRATFFQVGRHLELYPEIAQQVYRAGHEIGNHGWSHVRLGPHTKPGFRLPTLRLMYQELARTQTHLTQLTGKTPRLFRPPYGARWLGLDLVQRSLGLTGVQWSVIGHDWEWPAKRIAEHTLAHVTPGAILCLHDGRDWCPDADIQDTLDAVKLIVPALRRQGYSFETVSGLLRPATKPFVEPAVLAGC